MVRILFFLILLVLFFTGGFQGARWLKKHPLWTKGETVLQVESSFQPTFYPIENLPFAIVIVGRNNGAWLEKTLQSAIFQCYQNYRIIYVDDASDDGSFELARDLIYASSAKIELVRSESSLGFLASLAMAVQRCADQEIVVVLHGEDRLAHEWVLQRLNQYYANPDLWMSYGQYLYDHSYQFGNCRHLGDEPPRTSLFFASHLKTFYARLFRLIQETDLFFRGEGIGAEMALMVPMLEMAKGHAAYISDVLYIANKPSENRELLNRIEAQIRLLNPYIPLQTLFGEVR